MNFRIKIFLRSIKAKNKDCPIELKKIQPMNPNFQELRDVQVQDRPYPQFQKRLLQFLPKGECLPNPKILLLLKERILFCSSINKNYKCFPFQNLNPSYFGRVHC